MNTALHKSDSRDFYRKVFALVIPMALQNLINVSVTAADVVMLGKVGETVLSGASLAGQIQFIMTLFFFGITSGAAVLTAQYWGKRDIEAIEKVFGIAIKLAFIISVVFTVAALAIPGTLMRIYTSDRDVIREGVKYLRIVACSYLFMSVSMTYLNVLRSVERVVISTVVYLLSLLTNVTINAVLIFGLFGAPKLGIVGAAIGTLTARALELILVLIYAYGVNKDVRLRSKYLLRMDPVLFRDFLVYALPVVFNELMWGLGSSANTAVIGHLGSAAVAANSVAQVVRQLATVVAFGISAATAIMLGKTIGEMKLEEAKVMARRFAKLSIVAGLAGAALILISSPVIIANLSLSSKAAGYLQFMMIVMSYFTVAQSYNCTMVVGIFRSGGDTKFGLVLDVATMWGCSIILGAIAAFVFKWPVMIVYVLLMSDEIIKIPFTTFRYKGYKWLRNVTR